MHKLNRGLTYAKSFRFSLSLQRNQSVHLSIPQKPHGLEVAPARLWVGARAEPLDPYESLFSSKVFQSELVKKEFNRYLCTIVHKIDSMIPISHAIMNSHSSTHFNC